MNAMWRVGWERIMSAEIRNDLAHFMAAVSKNTDKQPVGHLRNESP